MYNVCSPNALCIRNISPIVTGTSSRKENRGVSPPRLATSIPAKPDRRMTPGNMHSRSIDLQVARGTRSCWHRGWYDANLHPHVHASLSRSKLPCQSGVSPRGLFIVIYFSPRDIDPREKKDTDRNQRRTKRREKNIWMLLDSRQQGHALIFLCEWRKTSSKQWLTSIARKKAIIIQSNQLEVGRRDISPPWHWSCNMDLL